MNTGASTGRWRARRAAAALACAVAATWATGCTAEERAAPDPVYISAARDTVRFPLPPGAAGPTVRAQLTAADAAAGLYMDVGGVKPRARLQVVLNQGPCSSAERPVADVGPVIAGPNGTASLRTAVPVPLAQLADGRHTLQLHDLGDGRRDFPPLACAPIPAVR